MSIKKEPFELVIHIDEAGTRATASYRIRVLDDTGAVVEGATKMESATLAELGADFPWKEFIDAATQAMLVNDEAMKAQVTAAESATAAEVAGRAADKTATDVALKAVQDELAALKTAATEAA